MGARIHPAGAAQSGVRGVRAQRRPVSYHSRMDPDDRLIAARLLAWYDGNRRDLPWRGARDPYRIWISEIMLQQTRAQAAIPYYARFLERFPTLDALAAAPESAVLACWSGLGY